MKTFTYRGFNEEGFKLGGSRKLNSENEMIKYLEEEKIIGYEIFESKTAYKTSNYASINPKELSIFCKQMSVLFFSQITLMEGVSLLGKQTENEELRIALAEIYEHMEHGMLFAEAMNMYPHVFGIYLCNMVMIGETSGTLDSVFNRMSDYFEKEGKVRKKIRSAITYPIILTILMGAIVVLLIVEILPMFSNILGNMGGEIPAITKLVLDSSQFLTQYAAFIILGIVSIIFAIFAYSKTISGRRWADKMKVTIPGYKYVQTRSITARFSRSMAILLKSGVQVLNAMEDVITLIDNKFLEEKFRKANDRLKVGDSLHDVLEEIGIFPPLFLRMVSIGQNTGHTDEMLEKCANVFDDEVDDSVERLTLMLEPILIIVLSVVVAIILISVMLPMIEIMNQIG